MNTRILDAVCILPRIDIFCDYLEQEIDQLENYAGTKNCKTPYFEQKCNRIRDLVCLISEHAKEVCNNVSELEG